MKEVTIKLIDGQYQLQCNGVTDIELLGMLEITRVKIVTDAVVYINRIQNERNKSTINEETK